MASNSQNAEVIQSDDYDSQQDKEVSQISVRENIRREREQEEHSNPNKPHTSYDSDLRERLAWLEQAYERQKELSRSRSRSVHRSSRRYRSRSPRSRSRGRASRKYRSRSSRGHRSSYRSPRRHHRSHDSDKYDSRGRKRYRSKSDQGHTTSGSESEYYTSDSSDRSSSRESRKRRNRDSSDSEGESFPFQGEMYVHFNKRRHSHVKNESSRIRWGDSLHSVKWHPDCSIKAFCLVKSSSKSFPYMDKAVAHDSLLSNLKVTPAPGENPGLKRKAFFTPFDPSSGLGMAMNSIMGISAEIMHSLADDNEVAAQKLFLDEAFEPPSIAIFPSGWPKELDYSTWAKGDILDLNKVTLPLDISTPKIHKDFQTNERDARAHLVNNLTGLRALELHSDSLDEGSKKSSALAIAKVFLPNIKYFVIKWMAAKMKLRKAILHNQDSPAARVLLKSNMWDPSIFPKEAYSAAKNAKSDDSLRNLLNLDKSGDLTTKTFDYSRYNQSNSQYKGRYIERRKQKSPYRKKGSNRGSNKHFSNQERKPKGSFRSPEGDKDKSSDSAAQNQSSNGQYKNSQRGKNKKSWKQRK